MTIRPQKSLLHRIATTTAVCAATAASLLAFPNVILWMVGGWLVYFTWIRKTIRFAWVPLVACIAILILKGPYWSPFLIALAIAMILIAVQSEWLHRTRNPANDLRGAMGIRALWLLWCVVLWESHQISHPAQTTNFDLHRPIVCLGDSLTTGLSDTEAFPRYLQDLVTWPVINLGIPGVTARDALKQIPAVLRANPQVVVIELGGHDFLRGYGRAATRSSLEQIVVACRDAGADVILFEIPRGFIRDPFFGIERELAHSLDIQLIPDTPIRRLVLQSSTFPLSSWFGREPLSIDGLHPNNAGAQFLAYTVYATLKQRYGPAIVKSNR